MTKPFFQLILETIENPKTKTLSKKHDIFKQQYIQFLSLLKKIIEDDLPTGKRAQLKLKLTDDFEDLFKQIITAENAYWYYALLKETYPKLYQDKVFGAHFELDENFSPKLVYEEMMACDYYSASSNLSLLLSSVYDNIQWDSTSITRIQILEQASLRNAKIINSVREYSNSGGRDLQGKLMKNILALKEGFKALTKG